MKYWTYGIDFYGNDVRMHSKVQKIEECMDFCLADENCDAFTYDPHSRDTVNCYLKARDGGSWTVNRTEGLASGHKCDYKFNPEQTAKPVEIYPKFTN